MDPVTAALQALNSFNQFLVTPAGQKLAMDFETLIADMMNNLHLKSGGSSTSVAKG
jgi:hypothetical protein